MIAGIHQPYFMPYLGYWQLINAVDVFASADNYNFIRGGWIHRNRILRQGNICYFNITIDHMSQNRYICDHMIKPLDVGERLGILREYYRKAPNLETGLDVMRDALTCDTLNLADFLFHTISVVCTYLGITTRLVKTSDYPQDPTLRKEGRIFDYCRQLGADTYYNAIGGRELYTFDSFREHGLALDFLECIPVAYRQQAQEFVPRLSIIDVIMNTSQKESQDMLASCRIITERN